MMKKLTTYITEKFRVNKDTQVYTYVPKTFKELRKIIIQRYKEQGLGTEQKPIDFNDIDISNIVSFCDLTIGIFDATKFEYIDISEWDVSNVEDMSYMFYECNQLKSVGNLSNWNVSSVKTTYGMFAECKNLKSVGDLSNWDVSSVEDIACMFYQCVNLKDIGNLSKWDVSKVRYMGKMFNQTGITKKPKWYKG